MIRDGDHQRPAPQEGYDSSRPTGLLAALALVAVAVAAAVVSRPEPVHGPLVGELSPPAELVEIAAARAAAADAEEARAPDRERLDRERLDRGVERLGELPGLQSVLVMRGDEVVADESFAGSGLNRRPTDVKSASKSVLSALVGIAIERGEIDGLDATVGELLPDYARGLPEDKQRITLGDLLAMESGLASTSGEHYGAWVGHDDWTEAALARPLDSDPGGAFTYSTGNSHLVSAILTEATGESTLDFAREALFGPLGIEVAGWDRSPEGYYFGGNSLRITPRDLATFGRLYLRGGEWEGRQLVPRRWIEASTRRHSEGWPDRYGAYGYFWWLPPDDPRDSYAAIGYGGQFLYIVPELDMLAVVTSTLEGKGAEWDRRAFSILRQDVFGAAAE